MKIYILGLGSGSIDLISKKAYELLKQDDIKKIFRTEKHEIVEQLKNEKVIFESMDYIYEQADNFEQVYESISDIVIECAKQHNNIIYAVPGSPFITEDTTNKIIDKANEIGIQIEIIPSVSFIDASICAIKIDPTKKLYITDIFNIERDKLNVTDNILISQVYDRFKASELKLILLDIYDDEKEVYIVKSAGSSKEEVKKIKLYEMDYAQNTYNHLTSIFIVAQDKSKNKNVSDLIKELKKEKNKGKINKVGNKYEIENIEKTFIKNDYKLLDDAIKKIENDLLDTLSMICVLENENYITFDEIIQNVYHKLKTLKNQ